MNPARVRERGLAFVAVRGAHLVGVRLTFDKMSVDHEGIGHATLHPAADSTVEGVLYDLAGPDEIVKMDRFERTPIVYRREVVWVSVDGHHTDAWTYIANAQFCRPNLKPDRRYLEHLLAGGPYLSEGYLRALRAIPCRDD